MIIQVTTGWCDMCCYRYDFHPRRPEFTYCLKARISSYLPYLYPTTHALCLNKQINRWRFRPVGFKNHWLEKKSKLFQNDYTNKLLRGQHTVLFLFLFKFLFFFVSLLSKEWFIFGSINSVLSMKQIEKSCLQETRVRKMYSCLHMQIELSQCFSGYVQPVELC